MPQSLLGVMDNLFAACQGIYATATAPDGSAILVSYGDPGQYQPNGIVAVMDAGPAQRIDRPTSGTNRSRDMAAEVSVMFSVYVPGGQEAHQPALDSVLGMVRQLEAYFQTSPNERMSGACRDAWVSALAGPTGTIARDPANPSVATGRVVEATATVTALIRY